MGYTAGFIKELMLAHLSLLNLMFKHKKLGRAVQLGVVNTEALGHSREEPSDKKPCYNE